MFRAFNFLQKQTKFMIQIIIYRFFFDDRLIEKHSSIGGKYFDKNSITLQRPEIFF